MNKKVSLSIIIPTYNMGSHIVFLLNNIIKEIDETIEIIIINDGSTDSTKDILNKYQNKYDFIKVIHQNNAGSGPARNRGINEASGEYLYFPDADDFVMNGGLAAMNDLILQNTNADLIVFGYEIINGKKRTRKVFEDSVFSGNLIRTNYEKHFDARLALAIQGAPWNKLFRRRIIKENNIQFPPLRRHQDEVFISRFVNYANCVVFSSHVLYEHKANNRRAILSKFPEDYFETVTNLYNETLSIYETWKPNNLILINGLKTQYVYNVIKACDFLFERKEFSMLYDCLKQASKIELDYDLSFRVFPKRKVEEIQKVMLFVSNNKERKLRKHFRIRVFLENHLSSVFAKIKRG